MRGGYGSHFIDLILLAAEKEDGRMDVTMIVKIAGVGLLVSVVCQVLNKAGREEQAMLVSIAGVVIVLLMLVQEISGLFTAVRNLFGL